MNTQAVEELTGAVLGEAPEARSTAYWREINPGAALRPLFRCFAVVAAFASTVSISLMAVLSVGCYGIAALLGKISALRDAYQFLSQAYDCILDRLAQRVLRDPRDTPALRLMVSLTLTAVPIFLVQLALGKPRPVLVIAFYLSLYGLKFQRFVRMFSAKHLEAHRRQGYFSDSYDKVFGRYLEFFIGYLYGNVPELDRTVHVRLHHTEQGGSGDTVSTMGYDRTSRLDFLWYLSDNIWTVLGIEPYAYFKARGEERSQSRLLWGMVRYYVFFAVIFIYNWQIGILYVLVPLLCINFITAITAWVQHAFCDPDHPEDYFANTVTLADDLCFMNEGYHLCHHHRAGMHWTEMPAHLERISSQMKDSGSLVFREMDFIDLFCELTVRRRMNVLARKLITWEPMSEEEKLALLAKRTKPQSSVPA